MTVISAVERASLGWRPARPSVREGADATRVGVASGAPHVRVPQCSMARPPSIRTMSIVSHR